MLKVFCKKKLHICQNCDTCKVSISSKPKDWWGLGGGWYWLACSRCRSVCDFDLRSEKESWWLVTASSSFFNNPLHHLLSRLGKQSLLFAICSLCISLEKSCPCPSSLAAWWGWAWKLPIRRIVQTHNYPDGEIKFTLLYGSVSRTGQLVRILVEHLSRADSLYTSFGSWERGAAAVCFEIRWCGWVTG